MIDIQELLIIPRNKNEEKEEIWGIQRLESMYQESKDLDLLMECVKVYPDQFVWE